jgi:hypothetical protein
MNELIKILKIVGACGILVVLMFALYYLTGGIRYFIKKYKDLKDKK